MRHSAKETLNKCGAGALAREKPGISTGVIAHRILVQSFSNTFGGEHAPESQCLAAVKRFAKRGNLCGHIDNRKDYPMKS
jgi:hypothetical protein